MGASRWTPTTFSMAIRASLLSSTALAMGATGVIALPMSTV